MKANRPIGIFDSGIGGLTVAKALVEALPNESIIYFGDTLHLPYGGKSATTIQNYAKKITDFLLKQDVKLLLIACNSASAAAYEVLGEYIGVQALLVNVIDPVVKFLHENYTGKRIGLIGTKLTIDSNVYQHRLNKINSQIDLRSVATPLLVSIIEEGFFAHKLMDIALAEYLSHPILQSIEALVLGCTHYPIIKTKIAEFYQYKVDLIDSSKIIAAAVKSLLTTKELLSTTPSVRHFYVSDHTKNFVHRTQVFFGEEVKVEVLDIF